MIVATRANPICVRRSRKPSDRGRRSTASAKRNVSCPPSRMGIGRRLSSARLTERTAMSASNDGTPWRAASPESRPIVMGPPTSESDPSPTSNPLRNRSTWTPSGASRAARDGVQVLRFLKGLLVGEGSLSEVGGPITIGRLSGEAARQGVPSLLALMAVLSVNLALLNLLPIPILDGGQLTFLLAEAVLRRPLSLGLRLRLTQIGFALVATIMLVVIGREVLGLFGR